MNREKETRFDKRIWHILYQYQHLDQKICYN